MGGGPRYAHPVCHQPTGCNEQFGKSVPFPELDLHLLAIVATNAGPGLFTALLWTWVVVMGCPPIVVTNAGLGLFTALLWTWVVVHLPPTSCCNRCWTRILLPNCGHGWWYTCCPPTVATNAGLGLLIALLWTWVVGHVPPTNCNKC